MNGNVLTGSCITYTGCQHGDYLPHGVNVLQFIVGYYVRHNSPDPMQLITLFQHSNN